MAVGRERMKAGLVETFKKTSFQFFKFGIVGGVGFVIDAAMLYFGIYALGLGRIGAGLFSFPFAVTVTWIGNRAFTFKDAQPKPAMKQLTAFFVVCAIGLVFNRGTYSFLVSAVPLIHDYPIIGLVAGTGVGMFFNFFAAKKHVFAA